MTKKQFRKNLQRREDLWTVITIIALMTNALITLFFSLVILSKPMILVMKEVLMLQAISTCLFMVAWNVLNAILKRSWLAPYYVDDSNPNAIKLIGTVSATNVHLACKALLGDRQDYKFIANAYRQYGCEIVAVKATEKEVSDKRYLSERGVEIQKILVDLFARQCRIIA